jgi:glutamyl-tRNA synthetase
MSKRDKAKAARAAAREAAKAESHPKGDWGWLAQRTELPLDDLVRFMKKKNDGVSIANAIARVLDLELPMIDVSDFRKGGYLPEALVNYLALLGWSPGDDREIMTLEEMIEAFSIERITKTPARFDPDKLRWMNGEYIRLLPEARVLAHLNPWLDAEKPAIAQATPEQRQVLLAMHRQRIATFAEFADSARFYFVAPTTYNAKAAKKHLLKGGGVERLQQARAALEDVGRWETDSLERSLNTLCEQTGSKLGKYAQPLRIALSGAAVTPPIFDVLAFLGREEVLTRIDTCAAHFADTN